MQIEIDLKVILDTPFSIGTGAMADSVADKPLIKDAEGRPVIPGSSLKGLVRHECERIIRSLIPTFEDQWPCHPPLAKDMCKADSLCPVCRIFGSPWYPAPITFENLILATESGEPPRTWKELHSLRKTNLRFGVGINRSRNVVAEDLLYSTETYAPPQALVYQGRIWGTLRERREVALLLAGLQSVLAIGGDRSRGLGWCQIEVAVTLDGQSVPPSELLQELGQWSN